MRHGVGVDETFRQVDTGRRSLARARRRRTRPPTPSFATIAGPARALLPANAARSISADALRHRHETAPLSSTRFAARPREFSIRARRCRACALAQKYAVRCGGGHNHRMGLYDIVLIKENHIIAARLDRRAVRRARARRRRFSVEIEVENLEQLRAALETSVDRIMLDNFGLEGLRAAVAIRNAHAGKRKELEASGNIDLENVRAVAETGVDWISTGAITKHVQATDLLDAVRVARPDGWSRRAASAPTTP